LDASKWTTWSSSFSEGCRGNRDWSKLEYNLPRNLKVGNGELAITAKREAYTASSALADNWHYIGAYLGGDHIDWYLDGRKIYTDPNGFDSAGAYLIVNLSVEEVPDHPASPAGVNEAEMDVDSVSVYHQ
jgi:hypothetical protein